MSNIDYQMTLALPLQEVWSFLNDFNNWANCVDGYIHHREITPLQSVWTLKGELGLLEKTIQLHVKRMKTATPYHMVINFSSLQNKLLGEACIYVKDYRKNETKIDATIELKVKGLPNAFVRPILKNILPKMLHQFGQRIKLEILKRQPTPMM